ncbi:MAG: COX15/CtaA family protein [Chitinophagaceae bacterium]
MEELYRRSSKPIAIWLLAGVVMIVIQIVLGGITRLTGSGLSITEWDVVTGTLPPMSETQWIAAFEKYRSTPQFSLLNFDFTLKDFKFIFFWEWFHRFWARLIGVVFLIPFIYFLVRRMFKPSMVKPLLILFLLGALQGAVGWIMVASGLTGDAIYVKPTRLALHFIFAMVLLCYTFWFALKLLVPEEKRTTDRFSRNLLIVTILILTLQLAYGALMAGHKAASAAPTWPDINGYIIPPGMTRQPEGWLNLIDNRITVHFIHRGLAYLLFVITLILTFRLNRINGTTGLRSSRFGPLLLVLVQIALGIFAVLASTRIIPNQWGTFEWLAQLHQAVAMLLLLSYVWILFRVTGKHL